MQNDPPRKYLANNRVHALQNPTSADIIEYPPNYARLGEGGFAPKSMSQKIAARNVRLNPCLGPRMRHGPWRRRVREHRPAVDLEELPWRVRPGRLAGHLPRPAVIIRHGKPGTDGLRSTVYLSCVFAWQDATARGPLALALLALVGGAMTVYTAPHLAPWTVRPVSSSGPPPIFLCSSLCPPSVRDCTPCLPHHPPPYIIVVRWKGLPLRRPSQSRRVCRTA